MERRMLSLSMNSHETAKVVSGLYRGEFETSSSCGHRGVEMERRILSHSMNLHESAKVVSEGI